MYAMLSNIPQYVIWRRDLIFSFSFDVNKQACLVFLFTRNEGHTVSSALGTAGHYLQY